MTAKISEETKLDWLRLIRSEHVGPRTFRALLDHCGGAQAAVAALPELARRGGASGTARICSRQEAERELAAMKRLGIGLLAMGEPEYPYATVRTVLLELEARVPNRAPRWRAGVAELGVVAGQR